MWVFRDSTEGKSAIATAANRFAKHGMQGLACASGEQMRLKAATTALCIIPSRAVWGDLNKIRHSNDRNFVRCSAGPRKGRQRCIAYEQTVLHRWPPHINLLYPFVQDVDASFESAARVAAEAAASVRPFRVRLAALSFFEHGPRSCTLWAEPQTPGAACSLGLCFAAF